MTFKVHGPHFIRSIRLECQNKYFLVWTEISVNKSIVSTKVPDRASVHDLMHFSVGICVRSYIGHWIHAVFLGEIFLGCCDLLLNGRETVKIYIYICEGKL